MGFISLRVNGLERVRKNFIKNAEEIGGDKVINIQISGHGNSSSSLNRMKAKINRVKWSRDAFFLSRKERKQLRDRIGAGIRRQLNGVNGAANRALKSAAESVVETFRAHIDKTIFEHNHKPLNDDYKRWKEKRYPGRPILMLTGDLYKSLNAKIRKG